MNAETSNKKAPIINWGFFNNWIDLKWFALKLFT